MYYHWNCHRGLLPTDHIGIPIQDNETMRGEYFLVLLAIVAFPVVVSSDPKLPIRQNGRLLLKAMVTVCIPFWLWDIIATARGHWSFNPLYTLDIDIVGMPLEEWLFFVVVAFVSIVTWESAKYFRDRC